MKRSWSAAGIAGAAAFALLATAAPAQASTVTEPADCSLTSTAVYTTVTYHMSCTGRPAGEQWQIVVWCNPRGAGGADWFYYGNVVTGNGTSTGNCSILNQYGYADISFSNSNLQPPGRQA